MNLDLDVGCGLEEGHDELLNTWENLIRCFPCIWVCSPIAEKFIPLLSFAVTSKVSARTLLF